MLDSLAVVKIEVLGDLAGLVGAFLVDRDPDLAAGAGHRLAFHAGDLALDVEVADLAEAEEALVEVGPLLHAPLVHVVREVVDVREAVARRIERGRSHPLLQRLEVDVVEADVADLSRLLAALAAPAVDEIKQRVADALDRRDVELARAGVAGVGPGAEGDGALVRRLGV